MNLTYTGYVNYYRDNPRRVSGFSGGGKTLDDAIQAAKEYADYLAGLNDGIFFEEVKAVSYCARCYGEGIVRVKRKGYIFGKPTKCPECKGKPEGKETLLWDGLKVEIAEVE